MSSGGVIKTDATDLASAGTTVNMRNQAQTHQVEVELSGNAVITLGFDNGVDAPPSTDGILDSWWGQYGISGTNRVATADFDGDGVSNLLEYRLGSSPASASSTGLPTLNSTGSNGVSTNGFTLSFQALPGITYEVVANGNLSGTNWGRPPILGGQINPLVMTNGASVVTNTITDTSATNSVRKFYKINLSPTP
ncbi:MAG: hypothetical protein EBT57_06545 [Verrucomicrobia bacterium]|nr:hypothetical protein [Verrucomicrobiota bacterium]